MSATVLTRIVLPAVLALGALTALSYSSGAASFAVLVAAWVALGVAASRAGHDSREGFPA